MLPHSPPFWHCGVIPHFLFNPLNEHCTTWAAEISGYQMLHFFLLAPQIEGKIHNGRWLTVYLWGKVTKCVRKLNHIVYVDWRMEFEICLTIFSDVEKWNTPMIRNMMCVLEIGCVSNGSVWLKLENRFSIISISFDSQMQRCRRRRRRRRSVWQCLTEGNNEKQSAHINTLGWRC